MRRRRLAETIIWCDRQQLTSQVNDPAVLRQHELAKRAGELSSRAYREDERDYRLSWLWHEAKRLCAQVDYTLAPLKDQLRSAVLTPSASLTDARSNNERQRIVYSVIAKRAELIGTVKPTSDLQGGRLLAYAPDENLADGAANFATYGFFDDDNVPPWDTWVTFVKGTLISWIPEQLVQLVQKGLGVNPEECIRFLELPAKLA